MKLKVTRKYVDRYTKAMRKVGEVIEVNEERGKELIGQNVAEEYTPQKKASENKDSEKKG